MNRWIRSAVVLVVLAVAACGDTSDSPLAPAGPRLNSGLISTGNSATPAPPAASDSTSTERSGLISSGN